MILATAAVEIAERQSRTIDSWASLVVEYYSARENLPPLPLNTETVLEEMAANDWSFLSDFWQVRQPGGTWYVAEDSELSKLSLPCKVIIFEDIRFGEIIVMSSADGTNYQGEAVFDAPAFIDLESIQREENIVLSEEDQLGILFHDLSPRRVVWEVELRSESDRWNLLSVEQTFLSAQPAQTGMSAPLVLPMSASYSNEIWLAIDGTNITVHLPDGFTNRVEIYSCDNLVAGKWSVAVSNLSTTGTNAVTWVATGTNSPAFFRAGNMDVDTDGDGLSDAQEIVLFKTNTESPDSDGDGYSDGSLWPAGYTNVIRGTNDAFPNDASAWRDTDGDGLPNEVIGDSESTPPLVEDLDDDGDGTNDFLFSHIWVSPSNIINLATNTAQWTNLVSYADETNFTVNISVQDNDADVYTMAKALVYVRTGIESYRTAVTNACMDVIGTEDSSSDSLALSRNLAAFVIAAELVGLPREQDMIFRDWLNEVRYEVYGGRTLISTHEDRPNNWGTMAGGSRAAIAVYLQDWDDLADAAGVFKGYLGDTNSYNHFVFGTNLTWQADPSIPVGINPQGATIQGHNVDGVLPDDQRRGGSFSWPPPKENYVYEALQGAVLQAVVLSRAGYDSWNWEDQAILRAFNWLYDVADYPAPYTDESWLPFVINQCYAINFPTFSVSRHGKNMAPTCWTHQAVP